MASIKNVQLKGIKVGFGHDGGGFNANIYLNNKKIGSTLDDGWGGPLQVDIEKEKEAFAQLTEEYAKEENETLLSADEKIIHDLLTLNDLEKEYKKAVKKGYSSILHLDYYPRNDDGSHKVDVPIPYPSEETYLCAEEKQIDLLLKQKKPVRYSVFRKAEDFIK